MIFLSLNRLTGCIQNPADLNPVSNRQQRDKKYQADFAFFDQCPDPAARARQMLCEWLNSVYD
jgi:hypothetical protein